MKLKWFLMVAISLPHFAVAVWGSPYSMDFGSNFCADSYGLGMSPMSCMGSPWGPGSMALAQPFGAYSPYNPYLQFQNPYLFNYMQRPLVPPNYFGRTWDRPTSNYSSSSSHDYHLSSRTVFKVDTPKPPEIKTTPTPDPTPNEMKRSTPPPPPPPPPPEIPTTQVNQCTDCQPNSMDQILKSIRPFKDVVDQNNSNIAFGAEKIKALAYQSCRGFDSNDWLPPTAGVSGVKFDEATLTRTIVDKDQLNSSHFYLQSKGKFPPPCHDSKDFPFLFVYKGGIPSFSSTKQTGNIFVKRNKSGPDFGGLNCSGFICSSMAAAGLKVYQNQNFFNNNCPSTAQLVREGLSENGCFDFVYLSKNQGIQRGDIVVIPKHGEDSDQVHHSMIVQRVEEYKGVPDAFGILEGIDKGRITKNDCSGPKISADNFKFTFIHSASLPDSIGISSIHARAYDLLNTPRSDLIVQNFLKMAREQCEAVFKGTYALAFESEVGEDKSSQNPFVVMRHAGAKKPQCVMDKPVKFEGEDCLDALKCNPSIK